MKASATAAKLQHEDIQAALQKDLKDAVTQLDVDINKVSTRVEILERWRWMIVGGAIALGYLINHLEFFSKMF